VTREAGKSDEPLAGESPPIPVLPMNLRVRDRFSEGEFEWRSSRTAR
jgi:hypothetical protein